MDNEQTVTLLRRYLESGDERALGLFHEAHFPLLVGLAQSYGAGNAAEDCAQEAMIVFIALLVRNDFTLEGSASVKTYLCRILIYTTKNHTKKQERDERKTALYEKHQCVFVENSSPDPQRINQQRDASAQVSESIWRVLNQLSPTHRRIWIRYYFLDETLADIGRSTNKPISWVHRILKKINERIRVIVSEESHEPVTELVGDVVANECTKNITALIGVTYDD